MALLQIVKFTPSDKKRIKEFVKFLKVLYKNDQFYIPPLNMELMGNKLLGEVGLLTEKHPFHKYSETVYFLAYKDGKVVGHIAALINKRFNEHENTKSGHFGFFEVIQDYEVAKALFDEATNWVRKQGMTKINGPFNFTVHHTLGMLIDPFDDYPFMGTVYNKPYYRDFAEKYGFVKEKDLIGQLMSVVKDINTDNRMRRLSGLVDKIKERHGIMVRPINLSDFMNELKIIHPIYNSAWSENWAAIPIDFDEFKLIAENLKLIADPGVFLIAYKDDKPVAFIGAVPDTNEMIRSNQKSIFGNSEILRILKIFLKRRKVKRVRLMLFGILKEYRKIGLDSLLYYESFRYAFDKGTYEECEISWLLEDNVLVIRAGESMNAKQSRLWRIYQKEL